MRNAIIYAIGWVAGSIATLMVLKLDAPDGLVLLGSFAVYMIGRTVVKMVANE